MISVVIVSYNTRDILRQCLNALFAHSSDVEMEVFVVDNDSRDGSPAMVRQEFPQITLMANGVNLGFAAANNQAFALARGEFILLLNPDAFVKEGAIAKALEFLRQTPLCGICGGRIVDDEGRVRPSARRFPNVLAKFFALSGLSSRYPESPVFNWRDFGGFAHDRVREVDWVPGTFTLLRRKMLAEIGNFDERFFMYYEETDLCLRAKKAGWQVWFLPDAVVEHIGGASSQTRQDKAFDQTSSQVVNFRVRSEYLYYRKHGGIVSVLANAGLELVWHQLRGAIKARSADPEAQAKSDHSRAVLRLVRQALSDTQLGKTSPKIPW
ncbi:glycosyltransferase family 2 protein [Desulfonatronum thioautotrophicum]|uniref:glycosyltransferase family 2 protein n=1 Tax=Desulfonatronum thioautotrophicum TaxID=617001 RepID=UPI0005EB5FEF|nr:glycosyltransferase family 2 protein [Desulfonatronum thioautotrophicum]